MKNTRAEVTLGILLLVGLGAAVLALAVPKPKFLDSRSREADKAVDTSKAVEEAVAKANAANAKLGATVAASHAEMGTAAGQLPDSPQKEFIQRELVWLSPLLPPPDPQALIAARDRRIAVLEGKVELIAKLYDRADKDRAAALALAAKAESKATAAFESKRESDAQLQESAAYARGKDAVIGVLAAIAVLAIALYGYAKLTGFGRADIARLANRVRSGMNPIEAIDATVPDWMHDSIKATAAKLAAKDAARAASAEAHAKTAAA